MSFKQKDVPTLIEQASQNVPGFSQMYEKFLKKLTINGYSQSTISSYGRSIAKVSIHFSKVPLQLDNEQIEDYLFLLKQEQNPKSETYFKHTVYGLRYLFRLYGREDRAIQLPQLKRDNKLPVVMSKEECRRLFAAANILKHRVMLAFIYSAGLRRSEVINLTPEDIDSDRMQIHIRQSKNRKDRYVVLSEYALQGLRKYWKAYNPKKWLFKHIAKTEHKPCHSPLDTLYNQ